MEHLFLIILMSTGKWAIGIILSIVLVGAVAAWRSYYLSDKEVTEVEESTPDSQMHAKRSINPNEQMQKKGRLVREPENEGPTEEIDPKKQSRKIPARHMAQHHDVKYDSRAAAIEKANQEHAGGYPSFLTDVVLSKILENGATKENVSAFLRTSFPSSAPTIKVAKDIIDYTMKIHNVKRVGPTLSGYERKPW